MANAIPMVRHLYLLAISALLAVGIHQSPCLAGDNEALLKVQEAGAAIVRGQFERAIELYSEALNEPNLAAARKASLYNDRGVAKWRLQRHKEAISDFNDAITINREFASVYNNRGNVLMDLGFTEEAIKDYDRAILLSTGYGIAFNNRANAYASQGEYGKALSDYEKAIEFMPTNAAPLNGRGKAHLANKRFHLAVRDFTRAIELNPKYLSAHVNRAQAYIGLEENNSAIGDLSFAISTNSEEARLYTLRGKVYQAGKKYRSARKDFDKAISLDESDAEAFAERGAMSISSGEFQQALDDLSYALQVEPNLAGAYIERALAHYSMEAVDEALKDIQKAIELAPKSARAHLVRAQIYEATGDMTNAIADYKKSFDLNPDEKDARASVERLTGEVLIPVVEKVGEPLEGWEITKQTSGEFIATHAKYDRLKVPLEMFGKNDERPQLLEWSSLKQNFKGIGLLRYYAGTTSGPDKVRVENIAVVDLWSKKVASIEPFKWGAQKSKWDWKDGSVVVTDHLGATNEVRLRKPRYVARQRQDDWWSDPGAGGWVYRNGEWVQQRAKTKPRRRRRHKKSFFEMLFN